MRQEKQKKRGRKIAKRKSQDSCLTLKPKTYLQILFSAHDWTLQADILNVDQKAMKCMTYKQLCGKF